MVKKVLLLAVLALALPLAAFASSGVDVINFGGTLTGRRGCLRTNRDDVVCDLLAFSGEAKG